jgi:hypothetical protein
MQNLRQIFNEMDGIFFIDTYDRTIADELSGKKLCNQINLMTSGNTCAPSEICVFYPKLSLKYLEMHKRTESGMVMINNIFRNKIQKYHYKIKKLKN